ncbi:hypothetical protein [Mucilaginibacter sp.]|uniref:hypothetical protein n=1 Tax=Mucilaginibacter sp. TaxID=1882438 RepID=UPI0035BB9FD3
MKKPLAVSAHGIIDYTYAAVVPHIPELVGFNNQVAPTAICRALGAGALTYTLLTDAKWGLIKLIPMRTHLLLDLSASTFAILSPWLLGFQKKNARNALMLIGATGLLVSLLTDARKRN